MKIVPLGDRLLVRRDEAEDRSKGGIIMPDAAKERPRTGTVLAVGGGVESRPSLKEGARVLFSSYGAVQFDHRDERTVLVDEKHVLAVLQ